MGYQESLVAVRPPEYIYRVVRRCETQRKSGFYTENPCTIELRSVLVLKRPLGAFSAGSKLLWVMGDRSFHNYGGLLDLRKQISYSTIKLDFMPIEKLIKPTDIAGIDLSDNTHPSENALFKRYSPSDFIKEREAEKGER
jgi:hypothetical protein